MRLKLDVFSLSSGELLGSMVSGTISDTASKAHGAMDLHDATPLRSCAKGGRKVMMIAEFGIAKDVEPRFQLYDADDKRLKDFEEQFIEQPRASETTVMKETIIFITPPQPHAETLMRNGWKLKLAARRNSDGLVSKKKFDFDYVPHDFYSPCVFCFIGPDSLSPGQATIVTLRDLPRPGLRKRRMSGTEDRDFSSDHPAADRDSPARESPIPPAAQHFLYSAAASSTPWTPTLSSTSSSTPTAPSVTSSSMQKIPRLIPIPIDQLTCSDDTIDSPPLVIKVESEDEEVVREEDMENAEVPFHDLTKARVLQVSSGSGAVTRTFPVTLHSPTDSVVFPPTPINSSRTGGSSKLFTKQYFSHEN
jgi:hypothetical protein